MNKLQIKRGKFTILNSMCRNKSLFWRLKKQNYYNSKW